MKKIMFLSVLILMFGCVSVFAQRGNRGAGRGPNQANRGAATQNRTAGQAGQNRRAQNKRKARSVRGLDLSSDQKQQIQDIRTAAKENGTERETVNGQIRGVLTEAQTEKLDARIEKQRKKRERKKRNVVIRILQQLLRIPIRELDFYQRSSRWAGIH